MACCRKKVVSFIVSRFSAPVNRYGDGVKKRGTDHLQEQAEDIIRIIDADEQLQVLWRAYQKKYSYAAEIDYSPVFFKRESKIPLAAFYLFEVPILIGIHKAIYCIFHHNISFPPLLNLLLFHCTTTSLYTDCSSNLYAGSPSYLLILFSALSAFAVVG